MSGQQQLLTNNKKEPDVRQQAILRFFYITGQQMNKISITILKYWLSS